MVEYLCTPDERLTWQANALPADELCVENAIMLKRFNRYPLVIDPSGQAGEFLMNQYRYDVVRIYVIGKGSKDHQNEFLGFFFHEES